MTAETARKIKNPAWGQPYGPDDLDTPMYVNGNGEAVWMFRKGQRCQFYDADANPVGPAHKNVVPAIVWALANEWSDPFNPLLSAAARREILAGGAPADRHAVGTTFVEDVLEDETA